ncbi:MAG: CPBP family intramembrane glutamic endopeptidase [Acidimicrobiales bacterium]
MTGPAARPGRPGRWSLGLPIFGFGAGLLVALVAESIWINAHHGQTNSLGVVVCSTVGLWVGLGGSALYASRTEGSSSLVRDFGLRFAWLDPFLGGPVGVAAQYLLGLLIVFAYQASGVSQKTINNLGQPAQTITGLAHGWGDLVLILVVVVGAPVVEELFFRGLLLRSLQVRIGSVGAVIVSGILFGLAHFEPLQLPVLALFGMVLGALALRTGRLGPGICAHAAFNSLAVYTLLSSR